MRLQDRFFLHVPMPSATLSRRCPNTSADVRLYAYDLVGFQTQRDVERFQAYVRLFGGGKVVADGELAAPDGHGFRAGAFPISIDTALIARQAREAENKPAVRDLRRSLEPRQLAIGVDRLDYSKGLPERFHGVTLPGMLSGQKGC